MGLTPNFLTGFEEFTCAMYGQRQFKDVNVLRYRLIKERCGLHDGSINLNKYIYIYRPESLPPCRHALVKHILRGLTSKWPFGAAASVVDNARTY